MVYQPSLEHDLLAVLKANLTIDHMRSCVISGFTITDPAFGARIMPELDFGLLRDHFHQSDFLVGSATAPASDHQYGGLKESAKQNLQRARRVH